MTDDIVTILRQYADRFDDDDIAHELGMWIRESADEIERLQKACDYYHKMCSMIADKNFTANEEIDRLKKELKHLQMNKGANS